jgi:hypothetical protein
VRLSERVEGLSDGLVSPVQAAVLNALRRALAIALAGRVRRRRRWWLLLPPILWAALWPEGAQ